MPTREPDASQRPAGGDSRRRDFVEVRRCDPAEAVVVRSLLESAGIPVLLRSRLVGSLHPFSVGDQGEVVVCVPGPDAPRARRLLTRPVPRPPAP